MIAYSYSENLERHWYKPNIFTSIFLQTRHSSITPIKVNLVLLSESFGVWPWSVIHLPVNINHMTHAVLFFVAYCKNTQHESSLAAARAICQAGHKWNSSHVEQVGFDVWMFNCPRPVVGVSVYYCESLLGITSDVIVHVTTSLSLGAFKFS